MNYDRYDNPGTIFTLVVVLLFLIGATLGFLAMTGLFTVSSLQPQHTLLFSIQAIALLMTSRLVYSYMTNKHINKSA